MAMTPPPSPSLPRSRRARPLRVPWRDYDERRPGRTTAVAVGLAAVMVLVAAPAVR